MKQYIKEFVESGEKENFILSPINQGEKLIRGRARWVIWQISFNVYFSDIVKHSYYGETLAQLLRFVELPPFTAYGDQIETRFSDIQYVPVRSKEFNSIQISVKDDYNNDYPFHFGKIIVVLHFRKRQ